MNNNSLRIVIVDDKVSNRNVLRHKLLENQYQILFEANDGEDFLLKMKEQNIDALPDLVIMDLEMPNLDGISAIAIGSSLYPSVKFVVLTVFDDDDRIFSAIKAGAFGYLLKEESGACIDAMIKNMIDNGSGPISPSIAFKILQLLKEPRPTREADYILNNNLQLSQREREILQLICVGKEYKEIADLLFISPNTAKKHCGNIYKKLHVNNKAQVIKIAYEKGWIGMS